MKYLEWRIIFARIYKNKFFTFYEVCLLESLKKNLWLKEKFIKVFDAKNVIIYRLLKLIKSAKVQRILINVINWGL